MHFCKYLLFCSFVILIKTVSCQKNKVKTERVIYELARTLQEQSIEDNVRENFVISPLGATLALAQINQLSCCRFKTLLKDTMKWDDKSNFIFVDLSIPTSANLCINFKF